MGAADYSTSTRVLKEQTTEALFHVLVRNAKDEHGLSGYTGTIAEKRTFKMVANAPTDEQGVRAFFETKWQRDPVFSNKWGPANCIRISVSDTHDDVIFFGIAPE
jgi:hypothetical protein